MHEAQIQADQWNHVEWKMVLLLLIRFEPELQRTRDSAGQVEMKMRHAPALAMKYRQEL